MTDLRTAAQQALKALAGYRRHIGDTQPCDAEIALLDALAQQDEPVATVTECEACFTPDVCQLRGTCDYYTASQMRIAAPPQRKPLTEEEIGRICDAHWSLRQLARAVERAHGIGEAK